MEGFNFNKKIEGSVEIMNADDLLELEKRRPNFLYCSYESY
jgi:hypothetical protein